MSSLVQAVGFTPEQHAKSEGEVDDVIERALLTGIPDLAIDYGWRLVAGGHLTGLRLCKLLYELTENWKSFNTDDDIKDAVFKGMGVPPETYRKYDGLWRNVFANPDVSSEYKRALRNKPIGGLIDVSVAIRDGEFNDELMQDLASAHDKATMLKIRDEARGIERPDRMIVYWERSGQLRVWEGEETGECGFLTHGGSPLVERAVDAIVHSRVKIIER
jgi:hypothetical protein